MAEIERYSPSLSVGLLGAIATAGMCGDTEGPYVRYSDHEARIRELEAENEAAVRERDQQWAYAEIRRESEKQALDERDTAQQALTTLRSAIKQHRNATEGRLKLLASSARVPESCAATADSSPRDASSVGDQSPGEPGLATREYQRARAALRYYRKDGETNPEERS